GMDRQELIDNLGTIARSGTKSFLARLTEAKDGASLIGQFGVGFYSAFMVAERIVVTSRRAGSEQAWTWSSSGGSGFEIAPARDDAALSRRGPAILCGAAVCAIGKAVRPVRPGAQGQGEALRPPCLHRRRCRAVAGVSALCPRRDR